MGEWGFTENDMRFKTKEVLPHDLVKGDRVAGRGLLSHVAIENKPWPKETLPVATLYFQDERTDAVSQYAYNTVTVIVE